MTFASSDRHRSRWPRLAALALAAAVTVAGAQTAAPAANTVRPEVAKPLQAAQEALQANKGAEALARAAEAEAVASPTPYEAYLVQRIKGQAAFVAGDKATTLTALEKAASSDAAPAADRASLAGLVGQLAYELKDYPKAATWLRRQLDAGAGNDSQRLLLAQSLYLAGDVPRALELMAPIVQADEAAGRATPEIQLRLLASMQAKAGDEAGYVRSIERLARAYPKPELWDELVVRASRRAGFAERLHLDVYRFKQAVGVALGADEAADLAQQAHLAGLPGEARDALDGAVARGLTLSAAAQKLRQQVTSAAARDQPTLADGETAARKAASGQPLFAVGQAFVNYGQADKGATLMAQGLAKGGVKNPDEAQLHLGIAQWKAGRTTEALAAFDAVKAADGSAELARLWSLWLKSAKK